MWLPYNMAAQPLQSLQGNLHHFCHVANPIKGMTIPVHSEVPPTQGEDHTGVCTPGAEILEASLESCLLQTIKTRDE